MHYGDITYRPPFEADSLLLQVTSGCSHNACAFCTMYAGVPFRVSPDAEVDADLAEARARHRNVTRIFLENGDPFALSTERLLHLGERIHATFPKIETITCYASILNLKDKSLDDLRRLRALGYNELNIGVESALDHVLTQLNTGYNAAEAYAQLAKLNEAGISFSLNFILGAEGFDRYEDNARANAALVNTTRPYMIFISNLYHDPGTPLDAAAKAGQFQDNTLRAILAEEHAFLEHIDVPDTVFYGLHPANAVPLSGHLPDEQAHLLHTLQQKIRIIPDHVLDAIPKRGPEGAVRQHY